MIEALSYRPAQFGLIGYESGWTPASFSAAAQHLGVWPSRIGELELGRRPNDDLAHRYREWLTAAVDTQQEHQTH